MRVANFPKSLEYIRRQRGESTVHRQIVEPEQMLEYFHCWPVDPYHGEPVSARKEGDQLVVLTGKELRLELPWEPMLFHESQMKWDRQLRSREWKEYDSGE